MTQKVVTARKMKLQQKTTFLRKIPTVTSESKNVATKNGGLAHFVTNLKTTEVILVISLALQTASKNVHILRTVEGLSKMVIPSIMIAVPTIYVAVQIHPPFPKI